MVESEILDKKAYKFLEKSPDWNELAKDCVSFANNRGGKIIIGIDDQESLPLSTQKIDSYFTEQCTKKITERTFNVYVSPVIKTASNGGEYLEITIARSVQTIACISDGKYYIRVADTCKPIMPDDLSRLVSDKNSFVWEEQTNKKIPVGNADPFRKLQFLSDVKRSERVSDFIKAKSDEELLQYYLLEKNGFLTNLGILWIGTREDRSTLLYGPAIQFIKYDETDRKINKIIWDDFRFNPKELLEAVLTEIPDWKESIEISDGIFRKNVTNYDLDVIRELVANALVHRAYTVRGDIFINLFPDRLEIHSPGSLPLGVTPQNIISQSIPRNTHLAKVFYDLKIMEKEGSGYDKVYEILVTNGKPIPIVKDHDDRVTVTIQRRIVNAEVVRFMDKVNGQYSLKQKELISLGIIAQHNLISAVDLSKVLNAKEGSSSLHYWLGRLIEIGLVQHQGKGKGTEYFINPEYLRKLDYKGQTTLKKIEPHRLKELLIEDLRVYSPSSIGNIEIRVGKEIGRKKISKALNELVEDGTLVKAGRLRHTKYLLN